MGLTLTLAAACAGAVTARLVRLPGGKIVGAMLATAAVSVPLGGVAVPLGPRTALFVGVGMIIGMLVTRGMVRSLRPAIAPALLSAVLLIVAGIGVALLLRALGVAPSGDVLATSPGGLSVLSAAAAEHDLDAPTVALFHVLRIVLILVTLPLVVMLLPVAQGRGPAFRAATGGPGLASEEGPLPPAEDAGDRGRASVPQLVLTALAATAGGLLATALGISGGLIFGTTLGAATVTLTFGRPGACPNWVRTLVHVGLGWMIGTLVTPESLVDLRAAVLPAILAAILVIASGIGVAYLLRVVGYALSGDVLATSPGALEVLATTADEHDAGPVQVALFHTVRVLLVIVSLPLLLALVP